MIFAYEPLGVARDLSDPSWRCSQGRSASWRTEYLLLDRQTKKRTWKEQYRSDGKGPDEDQRRKTTGVIERSLDPRGVEIIFRQQPFRHRAGPDEDDQAGSQNLPLVASHEAGRNGMRKTPDNVAILRRSRQSASPILSSPCAAGVRVPKKRSQTERQKP